jgi:hypothetical protein
MLRCGLALAHGWQILKRPVDPVFVGQGQGIDTAQGCLSLSVVNLAFAVQFIRLIHDQVKRNQKWDAQERGLTKTPPGRAVVEGMAGDSTSSAQARP